LIHDTTRQFWTSYLAYDRSAACENGEGRDLPKLELFSYNGKAFGSRVLCLDRGCHRPRIGLDCAQRIGNILERGDNRAAVLRLGLIIGRFSRPLLMVQGETIEHGRHHGRGEQVGVGGRREQQGKIGGAGGQIRG